MADVDVPVGMVIVTAAPRAPGGRTWRTSHTPPTPAINTTASNTLRTIIGPRRRRGRAPGAGTGSYSWSKVSVIGRG